MDENIISILEKIPKDILITCAENIVFKKKKSKNEIELEHLMNRLKSADMDEMEHIMNRIKEVKQQIAQENLNKKDCISRSKVPLRKYQIKAIKYISNPNNKSLLVVHGTGTGKTLTALAASQCYLDMYPNDKVVVISPASLVGNFEKEMKKYGGKLSENYSFYSFTKFTSLNKGSYKTPFDMYYEEKIDSYRESHPDEDHDTTRDVLSHEFTLLSKNHKILEKYINMANSYNIRNLYDCNNSMIIVDEAHNARNMGAKYEALFKCIKQSKKLILLTATPFVNSLYDFVPIINMLYRDENILKKLSKKIPKKISKESPNYYKALDAIYDMLKDKVTYLNDKTDEFFPRVEKHVENVVMSDEYYKKYEKAIVNDRLFGDAPEVFFNGFRRAVNKVGADEYFNQKLNIVLDIIDKGRQTLIFTNWVEAGVEVLEQAFEEHDISYYVISGEVNPKERLDIVEKFNDKKVQVLIITLAGSEGLDLKEVRDVIILDPVWNPAVMEQIIGRAVRFRSHIRLPENQRKVDVHQLILRTPEIYSAIDVRSGDEILYGFINEKEQQLENVVDILKRASI